MENVILIVIIFILSSVIIKLLLDAKNPKKFEVQAKIVGEVIIVTMWNGYSWVEILTERVAYYDGRLMYKGSTGFVPVPESNPMLEKYLGVEKVEAEFICTANKKKKG